MENSIEKNGAPVKDGKALPTLPTVQKWCKRDIDAAWYFLDAIRRQPELVELLAEKLYEQAVQNKKDAELLEK